MIDSFRGVRKQMRKITKLYQGAWLDEHKDEIIQRYNVQLQNVPTIVRAVVISTGKSLTVKQLWWWLKRQGIMSNDKRFSEGICRHCGGFFQKPGGFGRRTWCFTCCPTKVDCEIMMKYGITRAERDACLQRQHNACGICKTPLEQIRQGRAGICHDHCHKTGFFRGLLCNTCNLILGTFEMNVELLAPIGALRDYLCDFVERPKIGKSYVKQKQACVRYQKHPLQPKVHNA
jgi:hypothetical protein